MEDCGGVLKKFPKGKQRLVDLTNDRPLASFTAKLRADPQHFGLIIGKNGANIKKIKDSTGARFEFPSSTDDDREVITIIGKDNKSVNEAKTQLEEMIKKLDNNVKGEMQVEPRHHKYFFARKSEVLHRIVDECGGVIISFPPSGDASDRVTLKGRKECIKAAKAKIKKIIKELESMVTIDCVIPQEHHRTIKGAKGYKVEAVISEYDVQIEFPDKDNQEEYVNPDETIEDIFAEPVRQCDVIRITGKELNCEQARQALLDLVPITINVDVPFDLHGSIIGPKGRDVKDLRDKYDVQISVSPPDVQEDVIRITGTPTNVERAREAILERVKEKRRDRELRSFVLKIEVNPDYDQKIIMKRGAVIKKIRKDHDVQINFPKKGDAEEFVITITGYEENTYKAKEAIMEIVNELNELVREEVKIDSRVEEGYLQE